MRVSSILLFLLFCSFFVFAQPSAPVGKGDVEKIQNVTSKIPIGSDGKLNFSGLVDSSAKSKAELRVEALNGYIGPFSRFFFARDLSLSWAFLYALIFWLVLIGLLFNPATEIFDFHWLLSLLVAILVASLAMQGFGDQFVVWIDVLTKSFWAEVLAVFCGMVVLFFERFLSRVLGKKFKSLRDESDKEKLRRSHETIHADAEVSQGDLEVRSKKRRE